MSVMRCRRLAARADGQALVEFALVLPILVLILMGIIEFGRIFFAYLVITEMAREGARYAAVGYIEEDVVLHLQDMAGILDSDRLSIDVIPDDDQRVRGQGLTVKVDYSVDLVAPVISALMPDPLPLEASCTMRLE